MSLREGDLVVPNYDTIENDNLETGIVLKVKKREVASPHPNYRGKHPPIEVKVEHRVDVMWGRGEITTHLAENLRRIKKERPDNE